MENDSTPPSDPELDALLAFAPVPRKCVRRHGWTPANQRGFIRGVATTGDADLVAQAMGLTARGAYDLRKSPDHEPFFAAWDGALALYRRRHPGRTRSPLAVAAVAPDEETRLDDLADRILVPYMLKLGQEREARLAGRIVEADYYVRQLTWLEVALDLGEGGVKALMALKRGGDHAGRIAATPMSLLLGEIRRAIWAEAGEPERPPPPPLGVHDEEVSFGPPWWYSRERDGPEKEWRRRQSEDEKLAAEAQRAWEEKAKADAAAWRARVEGSSRAAGDAGSAEAGLPAEESGAAGHEPQVRPL